MLKHVRDSCNPYWARLLLDAQRRPSVWLGNSPMKVSCTWKSLSSTRPSRFLFYLYVCRYITPPSCSFFFLDNHFSNLAPLRQPEYSFWWSTAPRRPRAVLKPLSNSAILSGCSKLCLRAGWARALLRDRVEDVFADLPARNIGMPMAPIRMRSVRTLTAPFVANK